MAKGRAPLDMEDDDDDAAMNALLDSDDDASPSPAMGRRGGAAAIKPATAASTGGKANGMHGASANDQKQSTTASGKPPLATRTIQPADISIDDSYAISHDDLENDDDDDDSLFGAEGHAIEGDLSFAPSSVAPVPVNRPATATVAPTLLAAEPSAVGSTPTKTPRSVPVNVSSPVSAAVAAATTVAIDTALVATAPETAATSPATSRPDTANSMRAAPRSSAVSPAPRPASAKAPSAAAAASSVTGGDSDDFAQKYLDSDSFEADSPHDVASALRAAATSNMGAATTAATAATAAAVPASSRLATPAAAAAAAAATATALGPTVAPRSGGTVLDITAETDLKGTNRHPGHEFKSHLPRTADQDRAPRAGQTFEQEQLQGYADERTGIEVPSPLQLFLQYDTNRNGGLNRDEFQQLLMDLDGLADVPSKLVDAYVFAEFELADQNHDEQLSLDEFFIYYYQKLCFKFPVLRSGINPGADLYNIFCKYCSTGRPSEKHEAMGSHQFLRLVKECNLMTLKSVTRSMVDIVYSRAKAEEELLEAGAKKRACSGYCKPGRCTCTVNGTAKIYYPQFLFALQLLAIKRRTGFQEVVSKILGSSLAAAHAGVADFIINCTASGQHEDIEYLVRPRGLPQLKYELNANAERLRFESEQAAVFKYGYTTPKAVAGGGRYGEAELLQSKLFGSEPPSPNFQTPSPIKSGFSPTSAHPNPAAQPSFSQDLSNPTNPATALLSELYAGKGAALGGGATDPAPYQSLMTDTQRKKWGFSEMGVLDFGKKGAAALADVDVMFKVRQLHPDDLMMALKRAFEKYNSYQHGLNKEAMNRVRFEKALRDAQLLSERGRLTVQGAAQAYHKALPPSSHTLNFLQFIEALRHTACITRSSINEVMQRIVAVGGPI